jgi:hypothetical protein
MNEQQLETLLKQLHSPKAPQGMKDAIMKKIIADAPQPVSVTSAWPEKSLLLFSLLAAFLTLLFFVDLHFVTDWLWSSAASLSLIFSQNIFLLNKTAGIASKLPVYLLITTISISALLILERLILRRVFPRIHLL